MYRNDRKLMTLLLDSVRGMSTKEAVEQLWQMGVIAKTTLEAIYISNEVDRRVRAGEKKTLAIEQLSNEMSCSYEKVRSIVYGKRS